MAPVLLIAIGGAAGSIARYWCQQQWNEDNLPYGTLFVNIIGCFAIGVLAGLAAKSSVSESIKLLLIVGFCGGFTTFSAFTLEGFALAQEGKFLVFLFYTIVSVAGGIAATFAGYKLLS